MTRIFMKLFSLTLIACLCTLSPTLAQTPTYLPQDSEILQSCIEAVTDQLSTPETQGPLGYPYCIGKASDACQLETPQSQSTMGMVTCATRETAWWDELLNHNYATLKKILPTEEFSALRKAQRAWLEYRDTSCQFEYFYWREGTIRSIFGASCNLQMTAKRALDLNGYVDWTTL